MKPVEGFVQAVVAVVGAAQAGFQDLVDRLGLDVVPGVREELIVEDRFAAIERGQLDDIDQLAGLDHAPNMRGIQLLAGDLDVGRCSSGSEKIADLDLKGSLFWFSVVVRNLMSPWSDRDFDGRTSSISHSRWSSSPGRTGRGQRNSSDDAAAGLSSSSTRSRMVMAAVCHPLAASPRKIVSDASASSR
jgi:hypothetical protein